MFSIRSIMIGESCCTTALNKLCTCIFMFIIMSSGDLFIHQMSFALVLQPKHGTKTNF